MKIQEFYEKVSKNHDALLTLGEADMLWGFIMMTLNKLPQVKPDLVRTDDNWEDWDMEAFIDGLKKWLKRNKTEEHPGDSRKAPTDPFKSQRDPPKTPGDRYRNEKHWFTKEGGGKDPVNCQRSRGTPVCMYCKEDHWGDSCTTFNTLETRRKLFFNNQLCYNCGRPGHPVVEVEVATSVMEDITPAYVIRTTLLYSQYSHRESQGNGTSSNHPCEDTRTYLVGIPGHRVGTKFHIQ